MRHLLATMALAASLVAVGSVPAAAQDVPNRVVFTNVNVWDGSSEALQNGMNVLVEDNMIVQVTSGSIGAADATVVDGGGRTLMPGLIDMHSHLCMQEGMLEGRQDFDQMAMGAMTAIFMQDYLDQGFTTVMDLGCNLLGIAKAEHLGRLPAPRIYPSGAFLSQTGGHADTGFFNDQPGAVDDLERHGFGYIVDGVPSVLRAARQNFRAGATQIKVMAGGGVASEFDPIHTTQFTFEEMRAAVDIAEDYGSFVTVHAYHDRSVNRAIDAGVRLIQHNFLVTEPTIVRMKEEGIALSLQAVMSLEVFAAPEQITFFSADQKAKASQVYEGAAQMMRWALEHDLLIVSGGDMFGQGFGNRQADNIKALHSYVDFTPYQALITATSSAAEVLTWTGGMNPYRYGTLGTIEEGGYADILLVDGNPLENMDVIDRGNIHFVMKDGMVYKNTLHGM